MSKFYIVNDFDCPSEQLIAERRPDGLFYYIHPKIKDEREYHGMNPATPTPLKDFGVDGYIENGQFKGQVTHSPCSTYKNGRPRRWQGSPYFSFPYKGGR